MKYTLAQAAQEVKRSKSSLWRDVKGGKISCEKDESGTYLIDAAELFRVYPKPSHEEPDIASLKQSEMPNAMRIRELELLLEMERNSVSEKDRHIDDLKGQIEDTKKDRDHWRQQATYLLETKQEKPPEKTPEPPQSWLSKLFKGKTGSA